MQENLVKTIQTMHEAYGQVCQGLHSHIGFEPRPIPGSDFKLSPSGTIENPIYRLTGFFGEGKNFSGLILAYANDMGRSVEFGVNGEVVIHNERGGGFSEGEMELIFSTLARGLQAMLDPELA